MGGQPLKLRGKLVTVFAGSYILILIMLQFATHTFLMQGFLELEKAEIQRQTELGMTAMDWMVSELDAVTHDFAAGDDMYDFIQEKNMANIESLVLDSTFIGSEINLMLIFSDEGELVFSKAFDLGDMEENLVHIHVGEQIRESGALLNHQSISNKYCGVLRTSEGPMIVASRPIITGREEGPVRGTVVCARRLDVEDIQTLMGLTSLSLEILELDESTESEYRATLAEISEEEPIAVERQSPRLVAGYSVIDDIYQETALLFKVEAPREVYRYGLTCITYFMGSFLIIGITIGVLAMLVMDKLIISRLTKLSLAISRADTPSSESTRVDAFEGDEIFMLTNNIRDMLEALKEYQLRLKESERMATIGELSAMVGHDLRNPIQVVYGLCSILRKTVEELRDLGVDETQIRDLEYVDDKLHEQMLYMNKIVSDLQDYAKTIRPASGEVNIRYVIEDVISSVKVPSNVDVSVVFDEGFPELYVDVSLMRRMYTNLINNAVQAMPDGGQLEVEGYSTDEYALVDVRDSGVGISEENMGNIFKPLFTTKAKGTGLGLSVCERIVESHGGDILVESAVGVGSTFTVRLPLGGAVEGNRVQIMSIDIGEIADAIRPQSP
jgi:signal transduction histidine kinase